jgi:cytochrome c553
MSALRFARASFALSLLLAAAGERAAAQGPSEGAAARAAKTPAIVVIGATARSSTEIIWQALARGWRVTAVARDPTRIELRHERLAVLRGDVYDAASIEAALEGDEVVVSMVGPRVDPTKEVESMDLFTRGTANVLAAMKRKGNRRLLVASSLGVENRLPTEKPAATDPGSMWLWNSRRLYADMKAMEDVVRASGIEYVIFRPGFLVEEPPRRDIRVSVDADSPKGRMLTFADFAEFVLDQAAGRQYLGRTVGLYSDRELKWGQTADFARLSAGMAERAGAGPAAAGAPAAAGPPAPGAGGNAVRGRDLAGTCTPCHGENGVSPSPAFPIIAGQQYDYLVAAMLAYLSGTRQDSIMGGSIRTLSRSDIEDVAAYFAGLGAGGLRGGPAGGPPAAGATGAPPAGAAGPGASVAPSGALAAAMAAAEAARALVVPPPGPGRRAGAATARELAACARMDAASAGADSDGDGLADRDDGAPRDATEFAVDADGDGKAGICSARQLQAIAQRGDAALARRYELARDVDAAGIADFAPLGNCGPANNCMISRDRYGFAGEFDGNGHAIRNLTIVRPDTGGVGLFGTLARAGRVHDVAIEDGRVEGANGTGLLVGANFGVVHDCRVQGRVAGRVAIGGLAGGNAGRIARCRVDVTLEAVAAAGGLVGDMNGIVTDSVARVAIRASKGVGGLVGLSTYGTVENCATEGRVEGADNVGGLVGVNTDARLSSSWSRARVTASGTNAGGAVGFSSHSLVQHAYARGEVSGTNAVGGLVGRNNGALLYAYSTGRVTGQGNVGGLVGDNAGGTVQAAYWDAEASGVASGAGAARSSVALRALRADTARWDGSGGACAADNRATLWRFPGDDYPTLGCAAPLAAPAATITEASR